VQSAESSPDMTGRTRPWFEAAVRGVVGAGLLTAAACGRHAQPAPPPTPQNPSPMVELTRAHERLDTVPPLGRRFVIDGVLPRPIELFVPLRARDSGRPRVLVHFHGSSLVANHAVASADSSWVVATVNVGVGGGAYEQTFADSAVFGRLTAAITARLADSVGLGASDLPVYLSGFSAGYGAVRAIISQPANRRRLAGVLLLDGLHTGYLPPQQVLALGGRLDSARLAPFVELGRDAIAGRLRLVITHSEIFPGTFASTTETTDYLLQTLGMRRTPVVAWGPVGMQQLSLAERGRFTIVGFAGNSAPDHVDHLHALPAFLRLMENGR
jgi:hypothetical protein